MEKEEWKVIKGFESNYQVSNLGRVKSLKFGKERILKSTKTGKVCYPYLQVVLFENNKGYSKKVHQLVAEYFLNHTPCGHRLVVDHINDNSLDNRVENLQLVTQRENAFKTQGNYSSKYKGVHFNKKTLKYISMITIKNKRVHLGCFINEEEAYLAYQNKLKQII